MLEWLLELALGAVVLGAAYATFRALARRYARYTSPDSNAPGGNVTDWPGFFGRRRP